MRTLLLMLSLLSASACSHAPRPASPGLALQLDFEGDFEILSAAGLVGTPAPEGLTFTSGVEGRALCVDGSGASLAIPGLEQLGLGRELTLEFFVRPDDRSQDRGNRSALQSMVSHSDDFTLALDTQSGQLQARVATQGAAEPAQLGGGKLVPGVWHHVALVFDGGRARASLVLEGVEVSSAEVGSQLRLQPGLDLVVGTWFKQNQAFLGALDSVRLWTRVLSPAELSRRAQLVPGPAARPPNG